MDMSAKEDLKYSSVLISNALHASTVLSVMFVTSAVMFSINLVLSAIDSKVVTSSIKKEHVKDLFRSPILCSAWVIVLESRIILIFPVTFSIELTIDDKVEIILCNSAADNVVVDEVVVVVFVGDDVVVEVVVNAVVEVVVVLAKTNK